MQDFTPAEQLAEKIESCLLHYVSKDRSDICSVILGLADDFKTVQIWLDKNWEEFGAYDQYNATVTTFEDRTFVDAVQNLDARKPSTCLQDAIQLNSFGNTLHFTDESLNRCYQSLENRWRLTLVEAAVCVCKRRALGEFPKPVSFKVLNVSNGNHPDMVGIYGSGVKPMPVDVEIDEQELDLWVQTEDNAFNFVLTDPRKTGDFGVLFHTEGFSHRLPFDRITAYGFFENERGNSCLYLAVGGEKWKMDSSSGGDSVLLPRKKNSGPSGRSAAG